MTSASVVERNGRVIQIDHVQATLPADLSELQDEARAEDFRFVDRLADEWAAGTNRFAREGEMLLAIRLEGRLAGIGGLTWEPALTGALRMRRFYVRPPTAVRRSAAVWSRPCWRDLAFLSTIFTCMPVRRLPRRSGKRLAFARAGGGYFHVRRS